MSIMRNRNNIENFEQFLQSEADKVKIFPSDDLWSKIAAEVQEKKSWPALTIIVFLVVVGISIATFFNYPPIDIAAKIRYQDSVHQLKVLNDALVREQFKNDNFEQRTSVQKITSKTFSSFKNINHPIVKFIPATTVSALEEPKPNTASSSLIIQKNTTLFNNDYVAGDNKITIPILALTQQTIEEPIDNKKVDAIQKAIVLSTLNRDRKVGFAVSPKAKRINRFSYEIYTTPTVSYRKLIDNKDRNRFVTTDPNAPLAQNITNSVNNMIEHKPAIGTELGFAVKYNISKAISIKSGVQFNIRKYVIDAYQGFGVATIAVVQNNRLDSVNVFSRFSNTATANDIETLLDNKLYQISIPLGIDWNVIRGKRFGLTMGASIQPTYTLNTNVFMLSTDYKYYANGASFFRTWNLNTSVDVNVSYNLKHSKIYLGPQIRYQHLTTFNSAYPIKEYRWDYGVRIGIVKPF